MWQLENIDPWPRVEVTGRKYLWVETLDIFDRTYFHFVEFMRISNEIIFVGCKQELIIDLCIASSVGIAWSVLTYLTSGQPGGVSPATLIYNDGKLP